MRKFLALLILLLSAFFFTAGAFAGGSRENRSTTGTSVQSSAGQTAAGSFSTAGIKAVKINLDNGVSDSAEVDLQHMNDGNLRLVYPGTEPVNLVLSGTLDGSLFIESGNSDYVISLENAVIHGDSLPAMVLESSTECTIFLSEGTSNILTDGIYNTGLGTVFGAGSVVLEGVGKLDISTNSMNGFSLRGGLTVNGGNISITGGTGARGSMVSAEKFIMNGGQVSISTKGAVRGEESCGILAGISENGTGSIEINGGFLEITSVGKAAALEKGTGSVTLNGGEIYIRTTGTPYTVSENISFSPTGIDSSTLNINGGYIYAVTTADTLKAGSLVSISGGYVYAASADGSAVKSGGEIEISGGTVITYSTGNRQAFDCKSNLDFTYTGGTYIGLGEANSVPGSAGTTAYSITYNSASLDSGDQIAVRDASSRVVFGFIVPEGCSGISSVVIGSEAFSGDSSYTLSRGTYKGAVTTDGLVTGYSSFRSETDYTSYLMEGHTESGGYSGPPVTAGTSRFPEGPDYESFGGTPYGDRPASGPGERPGAGDFGGSPGGGGPSGDGGPSGGGPGGGPGPRM